jgi:TPR repeat protein
MRILTTILSLACVSAFGAIPDEIKDWKMHADRGDAWSQLQLGRCYEYGDAVSRDYEEAVRWYRKAAEQGDSLAQFSLGRCYAEGKGVTKDESEAVKWYKKSADQGDKVGQYFLGMSYAFGLGVPENLVEGYALWNLPGVIKKDGSFKGLDNLEKLMTPAQVKAGQKRTKELQAEIDTKIADKNKAEKK